MSSPNGFFTELNPNFYARSPQLTRALNSAWDFRNSIGPNSVNALDAVNKIAKSTNIGMTPTPSAASGAAANIGMYIGASQIYRYAKNSYMNHFLKKCAGNFNLSSREVEFISEYNLLYDQNIIYTGKAIVDTDISCGEISLNLSETAIASAYTQFKGRIPKGIY